VFESGEDSTAVLSGFTIQNGSASMGGGVFCDNSSPTITNVTVSGNTATDGGGIYSASSSPTITSTEVTDNEGGWGGGFCILFGSALTGGNPTISNTIVARNHGNYHGGGFYIDETNVSLTSVSITENTSNEMQGAGTHARNNSNIELVNVIHWSNEPSSIVCQEDGAESVIAIAHADIEGGQSGITTNSNADITWGDGNIDANPLYLRVKLISHSQHRLLGRQCYWAHYSNELHLQVRYLNYCVHEFPLPAFHLKYSL
jgi:predicted outer membrane repeat protein